ncbi:GMP synthase (glutamine-hydrolysing) [Pseudoduganella flava]|uniref:GMP synthase (Glutamine-hydrolysing) n=1 Tax=Pseudoduganella flava TaxID=871742 RepID=A0A562Q0Y1_9BURK|nr:glutamine amidotransferase [Pseudoduganella flava]QGZ38133.1 glutamine amidotransferase [Pseudoduganella flava]TWI50351.1 GMP synthase (glutamine-hydrolysing) [Pseudoduganella flava]
MKCIALYHVRFEDLGTFAAPLREMGYEIAYRHAGAAPLTDDEWIATDLVVVLGGPLGVNDTAAYPWLTAELHGLRRRLALHRPTLGICLGAQLIAVALGGSVGRRTGPMEIGWSALELPAAAGPLGALRGVPVLHWHGDNIVPPPGVPALAATPGTPCQAFQAGGHALAVQFHGEFDAAALEEWLAGHAVELAHAGSDLQALRDDTRRHGPALAQAGQRLLRAWLADLR